MLLLLVGLILSTGCTSTKTGQNPSIPKTQEVTVSTSQTPDTLGTQTPDSVGSELNAPDSEKISTNTQTTTTSSSITKSQDMAGFISTSFPKITETYVALKKSKNALDWKKVQDQALNMQIQVQDLKKTYSLDVPNPEKSVFPDLDSREQIVFLKYIGYLNDMESYAANLKNAVYYQEKGTDSNSLQTAHRYQNLADQFEKQVIAEVKTISDYCTDFKYSFIDPKSVQEYRYV